MACINDDDVPVHARLGPLAHVTRGRAVWPLIASPSPQPSTTARGLAAQSLGCVGQGETPWPLLHKVYDPAHPLPDAAAG
jgi:hypothetical protein